LSEPEPEPEPEPHRVTAPDPASTKRCGSLQLRLRLCNTVKNIWQILIYTVPSLSYISRWSIPSVPDAVLPQAGPKIEKKRIPYIENKIYFYICSWVKQISRKHHSKQKSEVSFNLPSIGPIILLKARSISKQQTILLISEKILVNLLYRICLKNALCCKKHITCNDANPDKANKN
jgi:hypothetical protein